MNKTNVLALLMVAAMAGMASANLITNGSFEQTFTGYDSGTFDAAVEGSHAYSGNAGAAGACYIPGWHGSDFWGYVWNPDATGINHFGDNVGLTSTYDGQGAYGSWGKVGHWGAIWQNTGATANEGDTVTLAWAMDALSADYGVNSWLNVKLQFIGGTEVSMNYPNNNAPYDTWNEKSIEYVVTASNAGKSMQVYFQQGGVWVDGITLDVIPEPATLGLFALIGGGMVFIRKRLAI